MTDELALHYEEVAYADDIAEGQDWEVPEDYERHYCNEDGEDWPCSTVRAVIDCQNPYCDLPRNHEGFCHIPNQYIDGGTAKETK